MASPSKRAVLRRILYQRKAAKLALRPLAAEGPRKLAAAPPATRGKSRLKSDIYRATIDPSLGWPF